MKRVFFFLFFLISSLQAEGREKFIVLREQQIHEGDYFAVGGSIEISGTVTGDVYVFGAQVLIDGKVGGDVIGSGGTFDIAGSIGGNVRIAGGQIEISGQINKNVTIVGGNVQLSQKGSIGGNAVLTAGMVDLSGSVGRGARINASTLRIAGDIGESLDATVGSLRISSKARIGENLVYRSGEEAQIDEGAEIGGEITYHPSVVKEVLRGKWKQGFAIGSKLTTTIMNFLFTFVIGWIFLKLFRPRLLASQVSLAKKPWKSLGVGILITILLPISCLILFITILGFPIALALLAFSILGFYSAKVIPIFFVSNALFSRMHMQRDSQLTYFLGLICFFLLIQIPVLGGLLSLSFTLLGLGALTLSRIPRKKPKRKKPS